MKKLLTLILAISMIASLAVAVSAATANALPKDVLGKNFDTKMICDFSEGSFTEASQKDSNHPLSTAGGKLAFSTNATFTESKVTLANMVDPAGYDGFMVYVDASEVDGDKGMFGLRVLFDGVTGYAWTRDNNKDADGKYLMETNPSYEICGYYQNDKGEWVKAAAKYDKPGTVDATNATANGERIVYPANYKGWIYIPFTSYNTTKIDNEVDKYPKLGLPEGKKINAIYPLFGNYTADASKNIYVDDVMLVKFVEKKSADTLDATSVAVACVAIAGAAAAFTFGKKKKF